MALYASLLMVLYSAPYGAFFLRYFLHFFLRYLFRYVLPYQSLASDVECGLLDLSVHRWMPSLRDERGLHGVCGAIRVEHAGQVFLDFCVRRRILLRKLHANS